MSDPRLEGKVQKYDCLQCFLTRSSLRYIAGLLAGPDVFVPGIKLICHAHLAMDLFWDERMGDILEFEIDNNLDSHEAYAIYKEKALHITGIAR